jgi:O-methyltransferase involved in polyketide biosynthesis
VFEVDFPATQAWRRELLAAAGIAEPPSLAYAPIDFEETSLASAMPPEQRAGFERRAAWAEKNGEPFLATSLPAS